MCGILTAMHGVVRRTDPKVEAKVTINPNSDSILSESQPIHPQRTDQQSPVTRKWQREIDALDALGFKTQPWKSSDSNPGIDLPVLDVNWLITQPSLPYLIQVLPTQLLHRSLHAHGIDDSLEVVEYIRGDALVRLLDYELWTSKEGSTGFLTAEEDLSAERFLQWIRFWNEISPEFASERLLELDEGVIVGCFTALCEIIPIGLSRHQEELSDEYWVTPDGKFGLKLKTNNESDFEILHAFIHSLYKKDILTAQHILAHSAMIIRDEALEEARRWRQGRLEDQGFVTADEARSLLAPKTHKQIVELLSTALKFKKISQNSEPAAATLPINDLNSSSIDDESLDRVREYIRNIDSEELMGEIERALGSDELLQLVGHAKLQKETLLNNEDVINAFSRKAVSDAKALLARLELHQVKALRLQNKLDRLLIDSVMSTLSELEPDRAVDWKTRLIRVTNTVSIALGVANETSELGRVLSAVRGCLNIGLENVLKNPSRYGIDWTKIDSQYTTEKRDEDFSYAVSKILGPETLFQLGWQTLQELASDALQNTIVRLDAADLNRGKTSDKYSIRLSDGETISISVLQLLQRGRYLEVRKWLKDAISDLDQGIQHVLISTVNRLPVFPIILKEENESLKGSVEVKPYETLYECETTGLFLKNLVAVSRGMNQGE